MRMAVRNTLVCSAAWGLLAVPSIAVAQTGPDDEQSAESGAATDGAIIVTARRREERVQDIPLAISAFSGNSLTERNVTSVYDLQRSVPNLNVFTGSTGAASVAAFSIRGQVQNDPGASFDAPVGVYFDGVAIPRTVALSGALVDLERIEVLRGPQGTLYGRNTTGGAVSIYSRKADSSKVSGFVTGEYGNYDRYAVSGAVNLPVVKDALGLRVVARYTDRDGYGRSRVEELGKLEEQYYRGNLNFDNDGPFKADLMVDYSKIKGTNVPSRIILLTGLSGNLPGQASIANAAANAAIQEGVITFADFVAGSNPANVAAAAKLAAARVTGLGLLRQSLPVAYGGTFTGGFFESNTNSFQPASGDRLGGGLTLAYELSDAFSVKSISGYQRTKRRTVLDNDNTPYIILLADQGQRSKTLSQELQINYTAGIFDVIVGGYYSRETGFDFSISDSLSFINAVRVQQGLNYRYKNTGIFGQANVELTDALKATLGVRYSKEDKTVVNRSTNLNRGTNVVSCRLTAAILDSPTGCQSTQNAKFSDISYLASLDYRFSDKLLAYAKVSRGFKGGGFNFRFTTAATAVPFEPENVQEYEAGLKFTSGMFSANLSYFIDKYSDIQRSTVVLVGTPPAPSIVVANAAKATIDGAELDWVIKPDDHFEFSGNFSYLNPRYDDYIDNGIDKSGLPFAVPKYKVGLAAKYTLPTAFGRMFARGDYSYTAEYSLADNAIDLRNIRQEGYGVFGARLQADFDDLDMTVALFGANLANKKYFSNGVGIDGSLGYNFGFQGMPRTYGISVTKRFGGD